MAYGGSWQSPDAAHRTQAERVIAFARAQIGRPCVWGAVGPGSYDAPGLTQAAWKTAGVTLPRTTEAQWRAGTQVTLADMQVGDLVFFHDDLRHVGICSSNGMMIHAPGPGARICEESVFYAGQSAIKGVIRPA
ncbi:C40 family peptidase [Streptomyces massasporeus]